jgi:hypothetical protein
MKGKEPNEAYLYTTYVTSYSFYHKMSSWFNGGGVNTRVWILGGKNYWGLYWSLMTWWGYFLSPAITNPWQCTSSSQKSAVAFTYSMNNCKRSSRGIQLPKKSQEFVTICQIIHIRPCAIDIQLWLCWLKTVQLSAFPQIC